MTMLDKKGIQDIARQLYKNKYQSGYSMEKDKLILIALSSALGGALLGILFAPEKGSKTRKNLAKKRDQYLKEIKKNTEELSQHLKDNTNAIVEKSKETVQNIKHEVEDYSEWTVQELTDRAKKLEIKGYSQMNKSELIQALKDQ